MASTGGRYVVVTKGPLQGHCLLKLRRLLGCWAQDGQLGHE